MKGYRDENAALGGASGENADFTENGGDGFGSPTDCSKSSPDNIDSIACTTSPRYFCKSVSTSDRRRLGKTLRR